MKKLLIVIGCLAAGAAGARQQNLAQLAPSQFADTEISTNVPCALNLPSLKEYRIGLRLVGTPSNNVEVALGHDTDGDGVLSLDEAAISLAWDCGEWMVREERGARREEGRGNGVPLVTSEPDTNGFVMAEIAVAVSNHKAKPAWLYDRTWDLVRVTRRGVDDPEERVSLYTRVAGLMILVK